MRFLSLLLLITIALTTSAASAQSVPPAWGSTTTTVADEFVPTDAAPTHHVTRDKLLIAGIAMLSASYVVSIAWGSFYLASLHLGPLDCNDQYAGWHFVPVVGPVLGTVAGGTCIHDGLHVEEVILPVVFSAVQFAAMMMTIFGALGHDVPDAPRFSFAADANGGYATLRGTF